MKDQNKTQGKIIIEFLPEAEGLNPKTGEPYAGSISIQMKAVLDHSDRVMALHALASSLAQGNNTETLELLHTARKLALHTCLTGESWCDVYEQTPDGTLIDKKVLDALNKIKNGGNNK